MKPNISVINYWHTQYGGIVTAYALQEILKSLDCNVKLVDNMTTKELIMHKKSFAKKFKENNLSVTSNLDSNFNLEKLNNSFEIFITGSDQVFRTKYITHLFSQYLLTYTTADKKRIAFSASFGVGKEQFLKETSDKDMEIMKEAMKAFDYVSVREKSGIDICRDVFGIDAEWIIDPVFILNKQQYDDLSDKSQKDYKSKIVSYVLRPNKDYDKTYKYLSKKYDTKVEKLAYTNVSLENWLSAIKNCRLLVTDSFHGVCFAIIFNKPFICIAQDVNGKARLDSIFELLGIENQSISSVNEIYSKDCIFKIDYDSVNKRISEEASKGLETLKRILAMPIGKQNEKVQSRITYLENRVQDLEKQANLGYQLKRYVWNKWLKVYHLYLPKSVKNMIKVFKNIIKGSN